MSWLEVVVLGIVQGLTEFLPISSSAHLRIVSEVFFGSDPGAAFTAVTQLGTEAAVLHLLRPGHRPARRDVVPRRCATATVRADPEYRLAWLVIIGTIPIGVFGFAVRGPDPDRGPQPVADRHDAGRVRRCCSGWPSASAAEASSWSS